MAFFNKNGGIWLVHSVPNFPPPKAYHYPKSATRFGQSLLCITMKYSELSKIGKIMLFRTEERISSFICYDLMIVKNVALMKMRTDKYNFAHSARI